MKKIIPIILSLFIFCGINVEALEHGAYGVSVNSSYYNPETGEIDDGGTANAALGDGMSRSCTGTSALIEKDGDKYYVTIRLLLQSSTNDAKFYQKTGYNSYSAVNYEIIAENAVADSVDYRFQVNDPFTHIKVSMYVVPMGRDVIWYINLAENTVSTNTGDFIVNVKAPVIEETVVEPEVIVPETIEPQVTEPEIQDTTIEEEKVEDLTEDEEIVEELDEDLTEDEEIVEELDEDLTEDEEIVEELDENLADDEEIVEELDENLADKEEVIEENKDLTEDTTNATQQTAESSNNIIIIAVIVGIVAGVGFYFIKKRSKNNEK